MEEILDEKNDSSCKGWDERLRKKLCFMVNSLAYLEGRCPNQNKEAYVQMLNTSGW